MKTKMILLLCFATASMWGQTFEGTSNAVRVDVGKKIEEPARSPKEDSEAVTLQTLGITKLPRYYALIIGVSQYLNNGPQLPNLDMPTKDAEKLRDLLITKYSFDSKDVTLLKNPTREEIINQFDRLAENISEKDNLLIFYAGHGFYDKVKDFGFWLPSDAKISTKSAWIANSTIKDYINAINSKHTLLITDACFGGSIFKTRAVDAVIMQFNQMYKDHSRKALTSGNLTEVPDKSVFLKYIIKTLEENNELFLSSSKLFSRIYEPILNNTPTIPQWGVIQGAGDEGGDFIFIKKE